MFGLKYSPDWWRGCAVAVLLVATYVALSWVSSLHQYKGLLIRPWNPSVGLMFAVILLGGPWYGLALFAGSISAGIIVRHGVLGGPGMLGAATIIAGTYTAVAVIARHTLKLDVRLRRLRDVAILLGAGIAGTAVVALLMTTMLVGMGRLGRTDIVPALIRMFVGNLIAIAVAGPLVLLIARRWQDRSLDVLLGNLPELALYAVLNVAMLWAIISFKRVDDYQFFYMLFLPVIAAAVRHGLDGACVTLAATQLGLVAALRHFRYDATEFTEFQMVMFVLAAAGLVLGAVVSERQELDRMARAAEARLKQKEAEAVRADRLSLVSGMASSLAHELNQPMTAARALARSAQQILRMAPDDLQRADGNLTNLIAQIDHAGNVVRRTRNFLSRAHPHVSSVDLAETISDALGLIGPEVKSRNIQITLDLADDLPAIFADHIQLQQVILNLVRNAIDSISEAGPAGGTVTVTARLREGEVVIGVKDSGLGVSEAVRERLFEPLTTSKSEGLGLGLPICAFIVESHGGKIWLESGAAGATEFRFSLPLETTRQVAS